MKRFHRLLIAAAIVICLSGVGYFAYGHADIDGDGLTTNEERKCHTDSFVADTDGDGLKDGDEVNIYHTNPVEKDTSGDGIPDGEEVELGLNPLKENGLSGYGYGQGLENSVLKELSNVSNNISTRFFIDYLAGLNNSSSLYLAQRFLEDKKLNETESNQVIFLHSLKSVPAKSKLTDTDWDNDSLTNYEEKRIGTNFSNNDTSGDGILDGKAVELGLDPLEKYNSSFVDLLSKLNINEQKEFIRKFVENKNLSRRGLEQVIFLNSLSSKDFKYFKDNNLITNQDIDNDKMSNFFEKFKMKLPWNTTNNRYFIYVNTLGNPLNLSNPYLTPFEPLDPWGNVWDQQRYLLFKYKFNPSRVFYLSGNNATFEKFSKLISKLSNTTTQKDILYIQLNMHGFTGRLYFNDKMITTPKLNEELNKLHLNRITLGLGACYSTVNETLNPLANGTSPKIVMGGEDILSYARMVDSWGYTLNEYLSIMDKKAVGQN